MRVLTINELMRMTRKELCDLAAQITALLRHYREGSPDGTTRSSTCATSAGLWRGEVRRRDGDHAPPACGE